MFTEASKELARILPATEFYLHREILKALYKVCGLVYRAAVDGLQRGSFETEKQTLRGVLLRAETLSDSDFPEEQLVPNEDAVESVDLGTARVQFDSEFKSSLQYFSRIVTEHGLVV
jgi:hypothetical protein